MHTNDWVKQELNNSALPDERLVTRAIMLTDSFFNNPNSPITEALKDRDDVKAAYRFFDNERVSPDKILFGHKEQTIERMKEHGIVLSIQDTTSFNYTTHPATKGLGHCSTSEKTLGILSHTALAATVDGIPLGILSNMVWTRDPKDYGKSDSTRKKSETCDKESNRWLETLDSSLSDVPRYINVITVCDREADIYDFFNKAISDNRELLVRVTQNRRIAEESKYLISEINQKSVSGTFLTRIPRDVTNKLKARDVTLNIKFCPITVKPPVSRKDSKELPNLKLYLVFAEEVNPPAEVEPIKWLLITTLPVETLDQAIEKIKWYKQRWKIERYHYILKSGCWVEKLQLEDVDRLKNALAIYSLVAWKVLWLKLESEKNPDASCDIVFKEHEWQALYCVANNTPKLPTSLPTLKEAVLLIARLGGFLGRKHDGNPGVKVIWRGIRRLNDISNTWLIARSQFASKDVGNV